MINNMSTKLKDYTEVKNQFYGITLCIIATLFFGLTSILAKYSYKYDATAIQILFFRIAIAAPLFWVLLGIKGKLREVFKFQKKYIFYAASAGILGYYGAMMCNFKALEYINPGLERMIFYTHPIFVIALNSILRKRRPNPKEIIVLLIMQIALYFMLGNMFEIHEVNYGTGIFYAFMGAFIWGFYTIINHRATQKIGSLAFMTYASTFGLFFIGTHFFVTEGVDGLIVPKELGVLLFSLAFFCTFISYLFYTEGIRIIGANRASLISVASPIITIILSFFILGERLTPIQILGGFIIIGALVFLEKDIAIFNGKAINLKLFNKTAITKEYKLFSLLLLSYIFTVFILIEVKYIRLTKIFDFIVFGLISAIFLILIVYWFFYFSIIPTVNKLLLAQQKMGALLGSNKKLIAEQQSLLKEKERFFHMVLHDLRTPMSCVDGAVMLAEQGIMTKDEALEMTKTSLDKIRDIANNLLVVAKMERGKLEVHKTEVNIGKFISEAVNSFSYTAKNSGIELINETDINSLSSKTINVDKKIFDRILNNLLSNAIKFTSKGGKIYVGIKDSKIIPNAKVLYVKDTGCGMSDEDLIKAMKEYEQAPAGGIKKEGMGLGLPIVRRFVEMHGGIFEIESKQGVGTKIKITIE